MLLLLHSTREIHIWSGGQVAGVEYDELRSKLMQEVESTLLLNACPMPKKIISYENSSEARSLYSRLEPSHMDPEFVQLKTFGSLLGELSAEQLKRLRLKMLPTDELTLHGYVAKLFASWELFLLNECTVPSTDVKRYICIFEITLTCSLLHVQFSIPTPHGDCIGIRLSNTFTFIHTSYIICIHVMYTCTYIHVLIINYVCMCTFM